MTLATPELLIMVLIFLLLFGGVRIPRLARSFDEASRGFKKGIGDNDKDGTKDHGTTRSC